MPNSDGPPSNQVPPKLTVGQRILAALPNLQRDATPRAATTTARRRPAPSANGDAEVVRPDAVIDSGGTASDARSGATPTTGTRLRDAFTKPPPTAGAKPDPYADVSTDQLRHAMKYLDDRERIYPLVIGPLLAILDIVLTIVTLHSNPAVGHKDHVSPSSIVALGAGSAVVALLVLVAAFYRRRSFTIFALLFAGYGGGFVTMIPSWIVAGWLFFRFNRMQKVVVNRTGGPAGRQRAAKARTDSQARPRLGRKDKTPPPTGPPANKRYTPPKPAAGGR